MLAKPRLAVVLTAAILTMYGGAGAATFQEAQAIKVKLLETAAAHAVEQQRVVSLPPRAVEATYHGIGGVTVAESTDWDVDGDGTCLKVTLTQIPANNSHVNIADRLAIRFGKPVNLLESATGIAFWIRTPAGLSADLRFGAHLKCADPDADPVIISDTPLVHKFGDNPHQAYLDWGYTFSHAVEPLRGAPRRLLTGIEAIELTFVQKRLPREKVNLAPASGTFYLDGVQLVDFYDGSYDSDRFPKDGPINRGRVLTSQGRTQQVAVICAMFGGDAGAKSALRAMDMMARIQCWDGSWPELQTRLQGEFTHGMILADMARALVALREQKRPELAATVAIRQWTMKREALYEQMIYRAATSRSPAPFHTWSDTYCSGEGALTGGCNRPMYFAISQYVAAQALTDPARKKQVLAEYDKNMDDLVAYQGVTAGGWPIFGEGSRYGDRGLHWDCSYTTDHVFIMASGSRATGDPRWGLIMRKFDTVVEAMMLADGMRIDGGLSERGRARSGGLKAPDIVFQEASRHGATKLAQWGANVARRTWANWPDGGSQWPYCRTARGYGLGAFLTWLTYDMNAEPEPKDLGHVFPRQWPIWAARWMDKQGNEVRRSKIIVGPGGRMVNTFAWEVGQYPVLSAIPLAIEVAGDRSVEISPDTVVGDVCGVPANAKASLSITENGTTRTRTVALNDRRFTLTISGPATVRVAFAGGNAAGAFTATPQQGSEPVTLTCRLLREPKPYEHADVPDEAE
jgi:hypothetical protein